MTGHTDLSPDWVAELAHADVLRALQEDVGAGDLTASLVDPATRARARVVARESAVICGATLAKRCLMTLGALLAAEGLRISLVMALSTIIPLVAVAALLDFLLKGRKHV